MHAVPLPSPWHSWVWERYCRRWPLLFYALMAVCLGSWWMESRGDAPTLTLTLVVAFVLWERAWAREVTSAHERAAYSLPLLGAIGVVLSGALTQQSLVFWLLGLVLVPMLFVVLPLRWAVGAAALLAAHAGLMLRLTTGNAALSPVEWAAFLLSRGILLVLLGAFLRSVVRQSARVAILSDTLANTRQELVAAERLTATLEERQRMARELHDTVSQELTATIMHIESAEQSLTAEASRAVNELQRAKSAAREGLEDIRRVVGALRPELLEHVELPEAIARATSRWSERTGIPVKLTIPGHPVALYAEADITLLRATQESLANIFKHAHATEVRVTLSYMGATVALDVRDNGSGFDTREPRGSDYAPGFGLTAMRERAELLGGQLSVESEVGVGTTVSVSLPTWQTRENPSGRVPG